MRKKRMVVLLVVVLLAGFSAVLLILSPFRTDTGIYIAADSPFILFDKGSGEPVVMLYPEGKGSMFSKLNVYFCIRLKKGAASDVPERVMKSLEEMGWKQGVTFGQD